MTTSSYAFHFLSSSMVEVALRSFQFLVEGVRSNWFGLACPWHCHQPSFSSVLLGFVLGLIAGCLATIYFAWNFLSLRPLSSPQSEAPAPLRHSALAEYLHEPASFRRRRNLGSYLHLSIPSDQHQGSVKSGL